MSRLLVVIGRDGRLDGALCDTQDEQDGARVFYRAGAEVARAHAGEAVVVRDLHARRALRCAAVRRPTIGATG